MTSYKWIQTAGGPYILVPKELVSLWTGYLPSRERQPADADPEFAFAGSDYARACVGNDSFVLTLADGECLAGEFEKARVAWQPFSQGPGGTIIGWSVGHNERRVVDLALTLPDRGWSLETVFYSRGGEYTLFDSACPGPYIDEQLSVMLPEGLYSVEYSYLDDDPEVWLICRRLRPLLAEQ